jgi:hypothetical protein
VANAEGLVFWTYLFPVQQLISLSGIKIRDTMNVNTEKLESTREGIQKLVRLLLGFKVILLQFLKVEVPHSSGHTIKANDKEMGKKSDNTQHKIYTHKEKLKKVRIVK